MKIGTIANLGNKTHFHLGMRTGPYQATSSGTGALPQTDCDEYPAFLNNFIDPEDTTQATFH